MQTVLCYHEDYFSALTAVKVFGLFSLQESQWKCPVKESLKEENRLLQIL